MSALGMIRSTVLMRSTRVIASQSQSLRFARPLPPFMRHFSETRRAHADSESLSNAIRQIQDKFVEAKDEYEMALESQGTTYAVEDNETARSMAAELKTIYDGFMDGSDLSEADKQTIKEKLSARIRELTNGVEHNLHDH